jgi:hypothetical protein
MPLPLKKETKTMKKDDKTPNSPSGTLVEHPQLKRAKAFALFLARCHAHNHGKPMPDPAIIAPAVFTKMAPPMSRKQQRKKLIAALENAGFQVSSERPKSSGHHKPLHQPMTTQVHISTVIEEDILVGLMNPLIKPGGTSD